MTACTELAESFAVPRAGPIDVDAASRGTLLRLLQPGCTRWTNRDATGTSRRNADPSAARTERRAEPCLGWSRRELSRPANPARATGWRRSHPPMGTRAADLEAVQVEGARPRAPRRPRARPPRPSLHPARRRRAHRPSSGEVCARLLQVALRPVAVTGHDSDDFLQPGPVPSGRELELVSLDGRPL